jgi:hypothetical protein
VCMPVHSVTLIGPLIAKSEEILTIVIARIETHGISVCQTSFHNLIQQNKDINCIQNRQHGYSFTKGTQFQNVDYGGGGGGGGLCNGN